MRTTVNIDEDVLAAAEQLRRDRRIGLSEAINELARAGVAAGTTPREPFRQRTQPLGLRVDVSNIGEVLDLLDQDR